LLSPNDKDVINQATLCSNHWFKGVKWIEFHQNQIMTYTLRRYIDSLSFGEEVIVKNRTIELAETKK
jgi:hypothetical protein